MANSTDHIFVGFSTNTVGKSRSWVLYDLDLIRQDLLNHFYTRLGERPMRPTFGCSIWNYIGEQMSQGVNDIIQAEVTRIVNLDSRLVSRGIYVDAVDHAITVVVDLYYRPFDVTEQFKLTFDARQ